MGTKDDTEAAFNSGITPDLKLIKKYDEIVKASNQSRKKLMKFILIFLAATAASYFLNIIVMIVLAVITILLIVMFCMRGTITKEKCFFFYKEGLLVPSIIVNTNPLTILACANLASYDDIPDRYACFTMEVKNLPGTEGRLYERIPCSAMFELKSGSYHGQFQPHPLCWATADSEEIRADLFALNRSMAEEGIDEWKLLETVAKQALEDHTIELRHNHTMIVDENFMPVSEKDYYDDDYEPCLNEAVRRQYQKKYKTVPYITDNIPTAGLYNQIIDMALKHQVYEYISTHCDNGEYDYVDTGGYYTYIGDAQLFMESMKNLNISLSAGEVPLIIFAGRRMLTAKGFFEKGNFLPWQQVTISTDLDSDGEVRTLINGKRKVSFKCRFDYYKNKEHFTEQEFGLLRKLERSNLENFLKELQEFCQYKLN